MDYTQLEYAFAEAPARIHRAFRYPAKFHPPVARALIERYSDQGDHLLDPFCGSGTLLVEGAITGRNVVGHDVDPLAVFVSEAKVANYDLDQLRVAWDAVKEQVQALRQQRLAFLDLTFNDLSADQLAVELGDLTLPAIPNLDHWFRKYVQLDLARLRCLISDESRTENSRTFLRLVFGASIRRASNADPVPVSGLEVTSHMLKRDKEGRKVDALDEFLRKGSSLLKSFQAFDERRTRTVVQSVSAHDARTPFSGQRPDAVITSPPYQNAVDYYRRHQLEMFWLGLTDSQADRLSLLPKYVGRAKVPMSDPFLADEFEDDTLAATWYQSIAETSSSRARDFRSYFSSMKAVFAGLAEHAADQANVVLVVGRSRWGDVEIPTEELFKQLVPKTLSLTEHLTYPISNRTMSYSRHNGANINVEHVLAFRNAPKL